MTIIGYARVSTKDQDFAAQVEALTGAGADQVFKEKESGAKSDRVQLSNAIDCLGQADTLIVTRLDRLARSTTDLLGIMDTISQRQAYFKSMHEPWADTTTPHGRMITTVFAGIAQFERELILQRTKEGRDRAMAAGKKFGRKPALSAKQELEAVRLSNEHGVKYAAEILEVSVATIERVRARARRCS